VTGAAAWDEDSWKVIRIGEVVFDVANRAAAAFLPPSARSAGRSIPGSRWKPASVFVPRWTMAMSILART
jgi:hypothetical protein